MRRAISYVNSGKFRVKSEAVTLHLNPGQALLYFQGFSGI